MQSIYLIGFMGAGKTTVGEILAKEMGRSFVDLDQQIEATLGKRITQIFAEEGESVFRQWEHQLLLETAGQSLIVATGGGIILKEENRQFLQQQPVVLLEKKLETILLHLRADETGNRPLLIEKSEQEIATLYRSRRSLYQESSRIRILIEYETPEEIVKKIQDRLREETE